MPEVEAGDVQLKQAGIQHHARHLPLALQPEWYTLNVRDAAKQFQSAANVPGPLAIERLTEQGEPPTNVNVIGVRLALFRRTPAGRSDAARGQRGERPFLALQHTLV